MLGRSVGILTTSALGAAAFLIPAGIAPLHEDEVKPYLSIPFNPKDQAIRLPCSDCVFYTKEENIEEVETQEDLLWIQGGANDVVARFTISQNGEQLEMNGRSIFPFSTGFSDDAPMHHDIEVDQVPANAAWSEIINRETRITPAQVTAFGVAVSEGQLLPQAEGTLIDIHINIMELENVRVTVDGVKIQLLRVDDSELLIMDVQNVPRPQRMILPPGQVEDMLQSEQEIEAEPVHPALHPFEAFREPANIAIHCGPLCQLRNIIASKLSAPPRRHGGCRKHRHPESPELIEGGHIPMDPNHQPGPPEADFGGSDLPREHHWRPHGGPHRHHGHHGHHRGHRFMRLFGHGWAASVAAALIPTLAGVAVGIAVSIVGLLVGRLIACFWFNVVRGGRRGNASVRLEDDHVFPDCDDSSKSMLVEENVDPLPLYEDAPAYVETEEKAELA